VYKTLYILATTVASILLPVVTLLSSKLRGFTRQRSRGTSPSAGGVKYWIHAASLGEYEMAIPILEKLLKTNSQQDILITIFSPSGYTQAVNGPYAERLMYLPLDTISSVNQFYKKYAPQKAIFIRYDFWYNFINEGQKKGTEFYLVNGRFQKNHFFFKWYGKPYRKLLSKFLGVYTSDRPSEVVLKESRVSADFLGDSRFDRVSDIAQRAKKYATIETFINGRKVLILGSSWSHEENLVSDLLANHPENLVIIIAPHDLTRCDDIVTKLALYSPQKYSEATFTSSDSVLILDTMGMLSSMYQYADFALVGGGFSGALHNILEPAVWGCHLSYGPLTQKFPEAQDFVKEGFSYKIVSSELWTSLILTLLKDEKALLAMQSKAKEYCSSMTGSTARIIDNIG
jgi:3-deoxy-D-manno-octulosonic-acid transferase